MGTTKKNIDFSDRHKGLGKATNKALQKVSEKLTPETERLDSYWVVSDEAGNAKKIPAKDL